MDSARPFFSVLIPTHNRPVKFKLALKSVLNQTFADYEVIIINDCSSVSYENVFSEFTQDNLTFINLDFPAGVSEARNKGALRAKGEWLVFLDDDDELTPRCLEERFKKLEKDNNQNIKFAWSNVKHSVLNSENVEVESYFSSFKSNYETDDALFCDVFRVGAGYSLSVDRQTFLDLGGFKKDYPVAEDTDLVLRLLTEGFKPVINLGIGVIVHHHKEVKLSNSMANRSRLGIVERLLQDHELFLSRHTPLKMTVYSWAVRTHYEALALDAGDRVFKLLMDVAMENPEYLNWCRDLALQRKATAAGIADTALEFV